MHNDQICTPLKYHRQQRQEIFETRYGKSVYYSQAFFSHIYRHGHTKIAQTKEFLPVPQLAQQLQQDFPLLLPHPQNIQED